MAQTPDLTVEEVAAELRLTYDTVLRMLRSGTLPGYRPNLRHWRVTRERLDAFKAAGGVRPVGRPPKNKQGTEADLHGPSGSRE